LTNLLGTPIDVATIPPAFLPFYTTSSGTSFSTPHVTGAVALMLEANPLLTPDEVVTLLRQTATPMPYEERVVGAGYLDVHNAVRAAIGLAAVNHPANLSAPPGTIVDVAGDQLGTTAHDIIEASFAYLAATRQIAYEVRLTDLSTRASEDRWTLSSDFGPTTIFVSAAVSEAGTVIFRYGKITTDPATGVRRQQTLGEPDSGQMTGNQIIIFLSVDKVNAAVDVIGTVSTNTRAQSQILIGTTLSGGLLLTADDSSGSNFKLAEEARPIPAPQPKKIEERFAGSLFPEQGSTEVAVSIRLPELDAKLNYHPDNQQVSFQLLDSNGNTVARAEQSGDKRIRVSGLAAGQYFYRVSGSLTKAIDFVINSKQSPAER
jgi:hypothetical protein